MWLQGSLYDLYPIIFNLCVFTHICVHPFRNCHSVCREGKCRGRVQDIHQVNHQCSVCEPLISPTVLLQRTQQYWNRLYVGTMSRPYLSSDYQWVGRANIVVQDIVDSNDTTPRVHCEGSSKLHKYNKVYHSYTKRVHSLVHSIELTRGHSQCLIVARSAYCVPLLCVATYWRLQRESDFSIRSTVQIDGMERVYYATNRSCLQEKVQSHDS